MLWKIVIVNNFNFQNATKSVIINNQCEFLLTNLQN